MGRKIYTRFLFAATLAIAFAGARAGMHVFAAGAGFPTLTDQFDGEGNTVTVAFAASGFPAGVTYSAAGLPPGLTMSTGLDSLGRTVGIVSGTLPMGADNTDPTTNAGSYAGSEGVYHVTVSASDGSVSNAFTWDVGRWADGDVFVGTGEWTYQVYSSNGDHKFNVTVPDDPAGTWGYTTGCAANWHTGEVWATNFDDAWLDPSAPAVNVITRHAGVNQNKYTDPSRRLSTARYGVAGATAPFPTNIYPLDINPESVVFDNAGDMFVGHAFGWANDDGDAADIDGVPVYAFDDNLGLIIVDASGTPLFDGGGQVLYYDTSISPDGFYEKWDGTGAANPILDALGQRIPIREQAGMDLHKYTPDVNGNYQQTNRSFYNLRYGATGVDTLDLLSDQVTINYTSESQYIYRYDVTGTGTQLNVLGGSPTDISHPIINKSLYGLRVLPPGDGTGGYIVVASNEILRLDQNGRLVQNYVVKDDPDYDNGEVTDWFSLAIAPDGRSFWAATRVGDVYHFNMSSGKTIGQKIHATDGELHTTTELDALCVMKEYRAAQEVCGPTGLGNGIDDDRDGVIDEGCFRVEICSTVSPGDDDGDGLVDYNDPDCGVPATQQCSVSGPTPNTVGGFCARDNFEGDVVQVDGLPSPCADCSDWTIHYSASGLPLGLSIDPLTGVISGVPSYFIVDPNSANTPPVIANVTVNASWQQGSQAPTAFQQTFTWTIHNTNRAPHASNDSGTTTAGNSATIDVRANDSDPDSDTITINSFTQPASGTGSVVQSGQNLVYTAPVGYSGTATFTYQLHDDYSPAATSNTATVSILVNGPPVAKNDAYDMAANTVLNVSVGSGIILNPNGRDTDPEGQSLQVVASSVTSPAHGGVTVLPNGQFTYTPVSGFVGVDTFTYKVTDGTLQSNIATVTITVHQPPVAVNDTYSTQMGIPFNTGAPGILVNDTNAAAEGGTAALQVVVSSVTAPHHGLLTFVQAQGGFTYVPDLLFIGADTFTYTVTNGRYTSNVATVTINVGATNHAPVAVDDEFWMNQGDTLTVPSGAILANDSDPDGDTLRPERLGTLTNGLFNFDDLLAGFTYTPPADFFGTVTFDYRVWDPLGLTSNSALVTIHVNARPVAVDDAYTTQEDTPITVPATGILGNDFDPDRSAITVVQPLISQPQHGTVTQNADGSLTYTPAANFHGLDSYTYRVKDASGLASNVATVTITVTSVNDLPAAVDDAFTTNEDTPLNATVAGNDTLSGDGGNTWTLVTGAGHGSVTVNTNGTFTYTPAANYNGTDAFTYKLCDVDTECANATVRITITAVNDLPVAVNDTATTPEDTPLNGSVAGNDTPSGDGGNAWTVVTTTTHGTLVLNTDGTFLYTPAANYNGTDTFTYKVCDVDTDCAQATMTITITSVNDLPLAVGDAFTTAEDTPVSGSVTANDTLSGDGGNTWTLVTNAAHGTASVTSTGNFTYTPAANYNGSDSFTYKLCDANNDCANATVTITITPVNDPPVAVNDATTTAMNTPVAITVLGNDSDPDGDTPLSVVSGTSPAHGTTSLAGNVFTYTPATGFVGTDSFTYTMTDGHSGTATATVTITIVNPNRPPVAVNDATTAVSGLPVTIPVLSNDSDPDGDPISITTNTAAAHGTVVRSGNTFVYTATPGFSGIDTFTYTITDGKGGTSTATVTITVVGCAPGAFTTYTQGGWGAKPSGNNPGTLLSANFAAVYPAGVTIGGGRTLKFTSAAAVAAFLPAGGSPSALGASATNPTSSAAGVFAGQVLALELSVDFSKAGIKKAGLGNLIVNSGELAGYSVYNVLSLANAVLGGGALPAGLTISELNGIVDAINNNFDNGSCDNGFLRNDAICSVNKAPVAVDDAYTATKNTKLTVTAGGGVKVNDSDPDGDAIVASLVSTTSHGTLALAADGSFTYNPSYNYVGADTFTYRVKDSNGSYSNVATVTITITSVACNLIAVNDSYETNKNHSIAIVANGGVLTNDQDPYHRGLTVSKVNGSSSKVGASTSTSHGTVKLNADGSFTYTPASNYYGLDSFTYEMKSTYNGSVDTATVTITVNAHFDGDGCDHDRHRNGHYDGDHCGHDKSLDRHYEGDGCDHDRDRSGHHSGDGCEHDRDVHRHFVGDNCDHERHRNGHYTGDDCSHTQTTSKHYDGDGCDHDRDRNGHKDGDRCDHDRAVFHHNDGDDCDHEAGRKGHHEGDKCDHDQDDHGHNDGDGCDHDRGRNGHYDGDRCEHDQHRGDDDTDDNPCVATTGNSGSHHSGGHDDQHHSGDFCDHERHRNGHYAGDHCDHEKISSHSNGDYCDHDRHRNGHYDGDRCDHDKARRGDRDWSWSWRDRD